MIIEKFIDLDIKERYAHSVFRQPNVIWVSELVQCCKKAQYYEKFPELYQMEPRFWLGKIVHMGFQEFLRKEYGAEIEVEYSKELGNIVISGRIDAIVKDWVVEIKYTSDVYKNEPNDHHVKQVQLYLWLTGLEKGKLIYISPKKFMEFDVLEKPSDDEVLMYYDTWKSPRYDWECNYCPFSAICSNAVVRR